MLKSMINPGSSGRKTRLTLGFMLIMLLALSTGLMAQTATEPENGNGSSDNPYQIASWQNLYWITVDTDGQSWYDKAGYYYIQTEDITFPADINTWDSGAGWSPINQFRAVYDGGNHTISGLYINRPETSAVGFFGSFSFTACSACIVKNLGLINGTLTGASDVGGFLGSTDYAGEFENCYSTVNVNATGIDVTYPNAGGFLGYACDGSFTNCYATGEVIGAEGDFSIGGFAGGHQSPSVIENCYSTGNVKQTDTSPTTPTLGGFIAWFPSGTIRNSYSTGAAIYEDASNPTNVGFAGYVGGGETMDDCFWDTVTSGQLSSKGDATGKTTDEMKTENFSGWDWTNTWERIGYNYPRLIDNPDPTLPVILSTFTALYTEGATQLSWVTQSEEDNIGWNVYRANSNDYSISEQINGSLIEGNGTTAEPSYYSFADESELTIGQTYYYWLESIDLGSENHIYNTVVNITIPEPGNNPNLELPTLYEIGTAPNPMQDGTNFRLTMDKTAQVKIEIYNIKGEMVKTLPSIIVEADAEQDLYWNGKDSNNGEVGSGLYFYKVKANGKTIENNKLIIMK